MPTTRLLALFCGLVLAGCVYQKEAVPVIVGSTMVLQADAAPGAPVLRPAQPSSPQPLVPRVPRSWVPATQRERHWTAIVIHHSATSTGNAQIFDQWHREENLWDGVGYDFVVGNGSDSPDGAVEVTFRWEQQRAGAHCGGTPDNWANEEAVGICLVGDFSQGHPTLAQMHALETLVRFLQQRYDIPTDRVYGHGNTPGARATVCPGRQFPMAEFKATLDR